MHLRSTRRTRTEMSLQDPIGVDREGNEMTLMDVLCTEAEELDEVVNRKMLVQKIREKVKDLRGRERTVIELRFGLGRQKRMTQREVAHYIGISRSYVSRIEKRAVRQLCQYLRRDGVSLTAVSEDLA